MISFDCTLEMKPGKPDSCDRFRDISRCTHQRLADAHIQLG